MHAHVAGLGHGCEHCFVSPELLDSYKYKWYLRAFGTSAAEMADESDLIVAERLREHIRSSRWIRQAVLLALAGVINEHGLLDAPVLRVDVARAEIDSLAFLWTTERIVAEAKAGQGIGALSSMLKYYGTELNKRRYELMMYSAGHSALAADGEENLGRDWLRTKANSIEGGTSEVQLNIGAKRILGLPSA